MLATGQFRVRFYMGYSTVDSDTGAGKNMWGAHDFGWNVGRPVRLISCDMPRVGSSCAVNRCVFVLCCSLQPFFHGADPRPEALLH